MTAQTKTPQQPSLAVLSRNFSPTAGGAEAYSYRLVEHLRGRYRISVMAQNFGPPIDGVTFVPMTGQIRKD